MNDMAKVKSLAKSGRPKDTIRLGAALPLVLILLAGVAISLYLTWHHELDVYGQAEVELANCPKTETVNCDVVNTSAYSEFLGMPLGLWGFITYLLLAIMVIMACTTHPRMIAYVFSIGILTVFYSAFLFYISKYKIGFLCLWCLRLYGVNLAIPILAGLAAWKTPFTLLRNASDDVKKFPREVPLVLMIGGMLLVATLISHGLYRSNLIRHAKMKPGAAEGSSQAMSGKGGTTRKNIPPAQGIMAKIGQKLVLEAGLTRLTGENKQLRESPFYLNNRIGQGKPLALIFWHPEYPYSATILIKMSEFFRTKAPEFEVYAISGWKSERKVDTVWESFKMLNIPSEIPLLIDSEFKVSQELEVGDIPNIVIIDQQGTLITTKLKELPQIITYSPRQMTSEELIRQVASGADVEPLMRPQPYYPSMDLLGKCAPAFTLNDFQTGQTVHWNGLSDNGKPTFLIFWSATCKHCQKEVPAFISHATSHPGAYNIVSVTHIRPDVPGKMSYRKITELYAKNIGFTWPLLEDVDGAVSDLYKTISTPTTFVITKSGKIADIWFYIHENFDEAMNQTLARLANESDSCESAKTDPGPFADFSLIGPDDARVALGSLISGPTLVHFWATWCPSCKAELPSLVNFQKTFEKEGGKVIYVSVEGAEKGNLIKKFEDEQKFALKSYRAPSGGLADDIDMSYSVPRTYLLGKGGSVTNIYYGTQEWDKPEFTGKVLSRIKNTR
jgi:thiol-disulfide isomerase/thioredoxin/uncharacterized membrane protein